MTAPISQTAFRGPGDNLIGGVLAHLRLADRLPLRVSCRCLAHWDDPALAQLCINRDVDLGTCGDIVAAITLARKSVASGHVDAGRDAALGSQNVCPIPGGGAASWAASFTRQLGFP